MNFKTLILVGLLSCFWSGMAQAQSYYTSPYGSTTGPGVNTYTSPSGSTTGTVGGRSVNCYTSPSGSTTCN